MKEERAVKNMDINNYVNLSNLYNYIIFIILNYMCVHKI